jgi:hypothetical protein
MPPSQNYTRQTPADLKGKPRTVCSLKGKGKGGKTHLGLYCGGGPTLYLPFDIRWRDTYEQAIKDGRDIYLPKGGAYDQVFATGLPVDAKAEMQNARKSTSKPVWDRFIRDLTQGAKDGFRNMVIDTTSEAFATYLSAEYGKTSSIPQHMWGPMYFGFGNALRLAVAGAPSTNIFLIHQLKDEYEDTGKVDADGKKISKKTGRMVADQCKKMEFFIDTVIDCSYDQAAQMFVATFEICSPNMALCGQAFQVEKENGMMNLAAEMFGARFDPADWE